MHFVFLNQYYPPDAAPTGMMLARVMDQLVEAGHGVTLICAKGGYALKESGSHGVVNTGGSDHSGGRIIRVGSTSFGRATFLGKLLDYLSFYAGVAWALVTLGNRPDRIVAMTTPPYLSLLARIFSKFHKADHAHWVMDLYPDVMVAHGMLKPDGVWNRVLGGLTRWGFGGERCACVLSLGPDMAERVGSYLEDQQNAPWVPLWSSSALSVPRQAEVSQMRAKRGWGDDELILMYSGNMGLGHLFDEVLQVAKGKEEIGKQKAEGKKVESRKQKVEMGEEEIGKAESRKRTVENGEPRFVFYGGGKRRVEVERYMASHPGAPIELHDYVAQEDLGVHLASADVHLVSLRPEWDGTMVPSKLQGVFAVGRPVIFIGSEKSSIGRWILESGGGWVVEPGDTGPLQSVIEEASDAAQRARRGELARKYAGKHFDSEANTARVAALLSLEALE